MTNIGPARIGCEVIIRVGDTILLGLRKGSAGEGTWGLPGGHMDPQERAKAAAVREVMEETGIILLEDQLEFVSLVDNLQPHAGVHYLHITFEVVMDPVEVELRESDRCHEWRFVALSSLPVNLFPPHVAVLDNYANQRRYAESSPFVS